MATPNIIIVITHDTGRHLSFYGLPNVPSPNLAHLANEGIIFDSAFCTSPLCSPSRGSLITGRYPHSNGLIGLAHRGWSLYPSEKTLGEFLHECGYETLLFGLQHETIDPNVLSRRYEHIYHAKSNSAIDVAPLVSEFLLQRDSSIKKKPFFAMIGFVETHRPYEDFKPADPEKVHIPNYLTDFPEVRKDLAMFYGSIRTADTGVGGIIRALDSTSFMEDTIFIYTTDHGIPFPRAKSTLYDPGLEISLIIRWPAFISKPKICHEMISNVDLLPTLLEIVDIPIPKEVQGKSLLSLIKEDKYNSREEIYAEKTYHNAYDPIRCIRTSRYKYIYNFRKLEKRFELPRDIEASLSAQILGSEYYSPRPTEELYDLQEDPWETINLIDKSKYDEVASVLRNKLMKWLEETNDPILLGDIPPTPEQYK